MLRRLPKRLELEKRKAKLAQLRIENASKPQFKSISEFLASLERCDSSNSNEGSSSLVILEKFSFGNCSPGTRAKLRCIHERVLNICQITKFGQHIRHCCSRRFVEKYGIC